MRDTEAIESQKLVKFHRIKLAIAEFSKICID